ncbi:Molybdenum cofactor sulfurase [Oopsacas minuta]|uniref:Molybdenum cofactor sulfurase n=1 Tax=Oopsacas minuta TaxID=111878 RepID=A0AAV7K0N4_9METZ|nr:Molybdenum cofactor sulfurase [Oopsacas minuta]
MTDHINLDRSKELPQLRDEIYLDNAGAGLPLKSHLTSYYEDISTNLYGNPHSQHAASKATAQIVDSVREEITRFMNTDLSQYSVIFTSGTTSACKLLADSFCWGRGEGDTRSNHVYMNSEHEEFQSSCMRVQNAVDSNQSCYIYTEPNHTSVVGIRQIAKQEGALSVCIRDEDLFEERSSNPPTNQLAKQDKFNNTEIDPLKIMHETPMKAYELFSILSKDYEDKKQQLHSQGFHLIAYPGTCNFSGRKYPIGAIERRTRSNWNLCGINFPANSVKVFVDTAAALSTSQIDLTRDRPHFIAVSFYKLFGFPTGIGALLIRNDTCHILHKRYFGGGSISCFVSRHDYHTPNEKIHDFFEDGTISYQSILALYHGFKTFKSLGLSMSKISLQTFSLTEYTHSQLSSLKHYNNTPVCKFYTGHAKLEPNTQGPILTFNVLRPDGSIVGFDTVNKKAMDNKICIRVGCFCNIGASQKYLPLSDEDLLLFLEVGHKCGDNMDVVRGVPTGAVRVSFGYYSKKEDADKMIAMIRKYFVTDHDPVSESDKGGLLIKEISLYPVKSCAGLKVDTWPVSDQGLFYDGMWVIRDKRNKVVNLTMDKNLSKIQPGIDLNTGILQLSYPGKQPISIKIKGFKNHSQLFKLTVSAGVNIQTESSVTDVNSWLSQALGYDVTLSQQIASRYTIDKPNPAELGKPPLIRKVKSPLSLLSQTSVDKAVSESKQMGGTYTAGEVMNKMRGNLLLDGEGIETISEHKLRRNSMNSVTMHYVSDANYSIVGRKSILGIQVCAPSGKRSMSFPVISVGGMIMIK